MYNDNWLEVPYRLQDLYVKYAAVAADLVEGPPTIKHGWILDTDEVGPVFIVKVADFGTVLNSIPPAIGRGMEGVQKLIGGPNPLTATLLGGALGAGLGYSGGWLAHKILPGYIGDDAARKWSMIGAGAGAVGPAIMHGYPNVHELGVKGLFAPSRYQGRQGGADTLARVLPKDRALLPDEQEEFNNAGRFKETLAAVCALYDLYPVEDLFVEKAADFAGSSLDDIPTDEWGRIIMYDPYLNQRQKAIAAGLPYAAAAATGSPHVNLYDVTRVAANTVLGRGIGWGIGQLAKTFLGLTPNAQQGLQQAGMLAGAVRGVVGMLA